MSVRFALLMIFQLITLSCFAAQSAADDSEKIRIAVISSYHPEYLWSQQTNDGVLAALQEFDYLDNSEQGRQYTRNNYVQSSKIILQKYWMDSKRKNNRQEIAQSLARITKQLEQFKPDLVLLGDDNAANYIGNYYLDTDVPVVFWGVNGEPLKYGLLDSLQTPGHNITGVYQAGYHRDNLKYLQRLLPDVKRMAILSDDSPTGRSHAKKMQRYAKEGELDVDIVKVVITNSFSTWKQQANALQDQVDAFFVSTHNTLKDDHGRHVNYLKASRWYFQNIRKPEITPSNFMVKEGYFATVDDSAFNQGYEAVKVAHSILSEGKSPATISSYAPGRGPFIVNRWRARMLGLDHLLEQHADIIDEVWDDHEAW